MIGPALPFWHTSTFGGTLSALDDKLSSAALVVTLGVTGVSKEVPSLHAWLTLNMHKSVFLTGAKLCV